MKAEWGMMRKEREEVARDLIETGKDRRLCT
jgi:hypothetical protein